MNSQQKSDKEPSPSFWLIPRSTKNRIIALVILFGFVMSSLPTFGIMNRPNWVGPVTLPVFWIFLWNLVTSAAVIVLHFTEFVPWSRRTENFVREMETGKRGGD